MSKQRLTLPASINTLNWALDTAELHDLVVVMPDGKEVDTYVTIKRITGKGGGKWEIDFHTWYFHHDRIGYGEYIVEFEETDEGLVGTEFSPHIFEVLHGFQKTTEHSPAV